MKKIAALILSLIMCSMLLCCRQDTQATQEALTQARKSGYDSAKKEMKDSIQAFRKVLFSSSAKVLEDTTKKHYPPDDGHIHDPEQFFNLRVGASRRSGVLAQIYDNAHAQTLYYIPFVIPSHLRAVSSVDNYRRDLARHTHLEYERVMIYIPDQSGNIVDSMHMALVKKIKP